MKDKYSRRSSVLAALIIGVSVIYLIKLFDIQVLDDTYQDLADKISLKQIKLYPNRGLITDRNGELLVYNQAIYDILVVPRQVENFDTALFCEIFETDKAAFVKKLEAVSHDLYYYSPNEFYKQIPGEKYALFLENIHKFSGFYGETRTIRKYTYPNAAHILGDVGEVDSADISNSNNYYEARDYTGKSGLEKTYDAFLRGKKGYKYVFIDKYNKEQGSFNEGKKDSLPKQGDNLTITLDIELQAYGEQLMKNKIGSIVAIEPSTGEILALVTSPNFDPNLLCGSSRGENYKELVSNSNNPLFNRAIMGVYPPGSTFKPVTAAIAMQEGAIDSNFYYFCNTLYSIPGYTLHCSHSHPSAKNVEQAIQHSCNPYFWQTFKNTLELEKFKNTAESYTAWYDYLKQFGLGDTLGVDLLSEKAGNIPDLNYYNELYGAGRWRAVTVISLAIGQGEISMTPIQLANLYTIFANRGYYYTPHLVKTINDSLAVSYDKHNVTIDESYFDVIAGGLELVVNEGTAKRSQIPNLRFGGKTGTAQNPHGDDHSIFAGFAPINKPEIAIAVVVENGGGGSRYAAPISSLMIEKYLHDTIADSRKYLENFILDAVLMEIDTTKDVLDNEI